MSKFKFSVGPWNIHNGADSFGPAVRDDIPFEDKIKIFKKIGIDAVQFHDDDVVPNIDEKTYKEKMSIAREMKKMLEDNGLVAEFVAPRLWESSNSIDGALSSNDEKERQYCIERSKISADIAREVGCDLMVFWFAREGTLCYESKDPVIGWQRMVDGLNKVLEHDKGIRLCIEPKPNEPVDRSFCPTMGHAMAMAMQTISPERVGGLVESAHAVLAGLDPANEMASALAFGKLFGVHLNDQNGMKYDQDKSFGVENLRQAFNQVKLLSDYNFGSKGEYIGLDVKALRTQPHNISWKHIENSMKTVKLLEEKVKKYDSAYAAELVAERNYEDLEFYILELLMNA